MTGGNSVSNADGMGGYKGGNSQSYQGGTGYKYNNVLIPIGLFGGGGTSGKGSNGSGSDGSGAGGGAAGLESGGNGGNSGSSNPTNGGNGGIELVAEEVVVCHVKEEKEDRVSTCL